MADEIASIEELSENTFFVPMDEQTGQLGPFDGYENLHLKLPAEVVLSTHFNNLKMFTSSDTSKAKAFMRHSYTEFNSISLRTGQFVKFEPETMVIIRPSPLKQILM